jgi:hypothetical protein
VSCRRFFKSKCQTQEKSKMEFVHPAFSSSQESYFNPFIDVAEVIDLRKALNG